MSKKKKKNKRLSARKLAEIERQKEEERKKQEHSMKLRRMAAPVLSCIFFYEEMVLKASTNGFHNGLSILYILLFSCFYGGLFWLLSSLFKKDTVQRRIRTVLIVLSSVWFTINYFIYYTFRIFYDLKTIFAGGGDAAGEFSGQILKMIFSPAGILHIVLFFLPVFLYMKFRVKLDEGKQSDKKERIINIFACAALYGMNLLFIYAGNSWASYTSEYSYQTSVDKFGLLTAGTQDLNRMMHGAGDDVSFTAPEETGMPAASMNPESTASTEPSSTPVSYGKNVMNIDFDQLAEEDTGTYRQLDEYVSSLTPTHQNAYTGLFRGKNLIFISAEAFSGYIIDPDLTPTLYRLANKGIQFTDYYQPASAGTTGGEYENIFGLMPSEGGSSFKMTSTYNNYLTMGNQLDRIGYNGWAFHDNDYTYYDRNLTHNNLGYSNGFMGYGNGMEKYVKPQWPQSDLEMMEGTVGMYMDHEPFNVYYMSVSGHNPYGFDSNAMSRKHQDEVQDLPYNDEVKAYIAANLELEDALAYLVDQLEERDIADDTVIVLGADHFPYGLDYGESLANSVSLDNLYGFTVANYLERDHNRLIIWSGSLEKEEPIRVDTPVSSIDILPTLSNLFGVEWDSRLLPGRDVFSEKEPLVFDMGYDWKTDQGTYIAAAGVFTPADGVQMTSEEQSEYVRRIRADVKNRMNYCKGVLDSNYFTHLFGERTDPQTPEIIYAEPSASSESEETETTSTSSAETRN